MAAFVEELWNSIFTPGTTPTLLIATNATFACLQLVLLALLLATYSIHFLVLSVLCGGLWTAINWFATELKKEQAREAEEKAKAEMRARQNADDSEETEVEIADAKPRSSLVPPASASKEVEIVEPAGELKMRPETSPGSRSGVSTEDEWEKVSENETEKDK